MRVKVVLHFKLDKLYEFAVRGFSLTEIFLILYYPAFRLVFASYIRYYIKHLNRRNGNIREQQT